MMSGFIAVYTEKIIQRKTILSNWTLAKWAIKVVCLYKSK